MVDLLIHPRAIRALRQKKFSEAMLMYSKVQMIQASALRMLRPQWHSEASQLFSKMEQLRQWAQHLEQLM